MVRWMTGSIRDVETFTSNTTAYLRKQSLPARLKGGESHDMVVGLGQHRLYSHVAHLLVEVLARLFFGSSWVTSATNNLHEFSRALRSEEHTSELQSRLHIVCRLLLEKKRRCGLQWSTRTSGYAERARTATHR